MTSLYNILNICNVITFNLDQTPGGNGSVELPDSVNILELDYQQLDIEENSTTLGWTFDSREICSTVFMLQGFNLSSLRGGVSTLAAPEFEYTFNSSRGEIPSNRLRTSAGDPIVYRLVAVDQNGTICSLPTTLEKFFRFDGV